MPGTDQPLHDSTELRVPVSEETFDGEGMLLALRDSHAKLRNKMLLDGPLNVMKSRETVLALSSVRPPVEVDPTG